MQIQNYLKKEKAYGAILGPFRKNPFISGVVLSPLNSVPKKVSTDRRVILDLSYPEGNSVNDYVSKDYYLGKRVQLSYPGIDDLVNIVKIKGRHCFLFKRDLRRAYRQISIDPGDISIVGFSFNDFMYFDRV